MKHASTSSQIKRLRQLYEHLRQEMRRRWDRDLPLEELLFDRWERAASLGFGKGASIYHTSYVYGKVHVGEKTWVGPFTLLDGTGGLAIGRYCSISAGVQIYTHDTVQWALSGGKAPYQHAAVKIGNYCFVGSQSVIAKGVHIGDHSVIGAGSFVNTDVAPYTIVAGTPARPIGQVRIDRAGRVKLIFSKKRRPGSKR